MIYDPHLLLLRRLFVQPDSDDTSHNETLRHLCGCIECVGSFFEHLDIDVGEEVEWVVRDSECSFSLWD
jgi:hypothetical protein